MSSLIGEIRERNAPSSSSASSSQRPKPVAPQDKFDPKTGFPLVQHRSQSKSAFARSRDAARSSLASGSGSGSVPVVVRGQTTIATPPVEPSSDSDLQVTDGKESAWRKAMSEQNEARVRQMSEVEREREAEEISETFGPGLLDLVRKAKRRRVEADTSRLRPNEIGTMPSEQRVAPTAAPNLPLKTAASLIHSPHHTSRPTSPFPPALRPSTPRPSTPTNPNRKIHFSEQPPPVHVYESAPSSPKRKAIALLGPPPDDEDATATGDGKVKTVKVDARKFIKNMHELNGKREVDLADEQEGEEAEHEGTPEYIRKRYFPAASSSNPALEWMKSKPTITSDSDASSPTALRYDLSGLPIQPSLQQTLPTHLGLHHHGGDQDQAGYTLDDLLVLSRSSVPAQRASMLGVLGKVLLNSEKMKGDLREKVLVAGLDAMMERGNVGIRGVEVVWSALGGCLQADEEEWGDEDDNSLDITTLIPPQILLIRISTLLHPDTRNLPPESLTRLLEILIHLASGTMSSKHDFATNILQINTPNLIQGVMTTFLSPAASSDSNPRAIVLLNIIARASRANAKRLVDDGIADTCLRFVLHTRSSSSNDDGLLVETLRFYITLGRYGLYTNMAPEVHAHLGSLILQSQCIDHPELCIAYLGLLETWLICATDPHKTTPTHDLLWSQVVGWEGVMDVLRFRKEILSLGSEGVKVMKSVWNVLAAWLDGCAVNAVKGGAAERADVVRELTRDEDLARKEAALVKQARDNITALLTEPLKGPALKRLSEAAAVAHAAIRLVNACRGSDSELRVPFSEARHGFVSLGQSIAGSGSLKTLGRTHSASKLTMIHPVTSLLFQIIRFSTHTKSISAEERLSLALEAVSLFIPGDEDYTANVFSVIHKDLTERLDREGSPGVPANFSIQSALDAITPFLIHAIQRREPLEGGAEGEEEHLEVVASYVTTPQSIQGATMQILPFAQRATSASALGLPLRNDWPFLPLNDLLRSGASSIWRSLPTNWDHSEVDVVRGTLLLGVGAREMMTREEVAFGCMRVFMLEHGQSSEASGGNDSTTEVFRDDVVLKLMEMLLSPYRIGASTTTALSTTLPPIQTLEAVALPFLGISTPFFQFYSDFLALYDSISFGHKAFGSLLLLPLAPALYPVDYRKLLWGDYPQVVRLLDFEVDELIGDDVRRWLWPIESDGEMLSLYLKALGRGLPRGFLRWVAIHHIAGNLWPDISELPGDEVIESRRRKLLNAVMGNAGMDVTRNLLLYRQPPLDRNRAAPPPQCFQDSSLDDWRKQRVSWVEEWAGESLKERVAGLLMTGTQQ